MVGGGAGADIGKTHRFGMRLDDRYSLDAGVFGRDAGQAARVASSLGVSSERTYTDYEQMAEAESGHPEGIDVAVVATPNDSHFPIAKAFLERGISVVCEKPLTRDSATAAELVHIAAENDAILAVPHCYSAYAMVRQAGRMVRRRRARLRMGGDSAGTLRAQTGCLAHRPGSSRIPQRRGGPRNTRLSSGPLHHWP